jgi:hypothetical protein
MAWIAFASVPTILVVMLAMGHLEARLLPQTPARNGDGDPIRVDMASPADAWPRWEVVIGPVEGREEAPT